MDTRPIKERLLEIGIIVSDYKNGSGRHELFNNGKSLGWFTAMEAIEKLLNKKVSETKQLSLFES